MTASCVPYCSYATHLIQTAIFLAAQIIFEPAPYEMHLHLWTDWRKFSQPRRSPTMVQCLGSLRRKLLRTRGIVRTHRIPEGTLKTAPPARPSERECSSRTREATIQRNGTRSGTIVESTGHDQYRVKVDGSRRLTLRNRRFPALLQASHSPLFPSSSKKHRTPPASVQHLDQHFPNTPTPQSHVPPQLAMKEPATVKIPVTVTV